MTQLSVNINKIALLRNARGRDYPSVLQFAERCLQLGAHGITLHPRPDQRHARYSDVHDLRQLCTQYGVELNVEGYPCDEFMQVVLDHRPDQCTLVPDAPGQITSDHGWQVAQHYELLQTTLQALKAQHIRSSLFMDHNTSELALVQQLGAERIELYTEPYAEHFDDASQKAKLLQAFQQTALQAQQRGLGVNAGHDLNLENLGEFLKQVPNVLEVSIGHALTVESLEMGLPAVIKQYLKLL